jgi:Lrp/AsnC family transcriptional regulator, leucine-responsive regulatory protein
MENDKVEKEYDDVLSNYYKDQKVKAIISLKVDTKYADIIAAKVAEFTPAIDVFLVTGDSDILIKSSFDTYHDLKKFIVSQIGSLDGIKETRTMMVVTTFKEGNEVQIHNEDL